MKACKAMSKDERTKFFNCEMWLLKNKAQAFIDQKNFSQAATWLEVCEAINKMELGEKINVDQTWLDYWK